MVFNFIYKAIEVCNYYILILFPQKIKQKKVVHIYYYHDNVNNIIK